MSLINREDALEALKYNFSDADNISDVVYWSREQVLTVLNNLPTIDPVKWIPVSERLPEEGKQVLVCDEYGFIYTAECEVISNDEWLDWQWYESAEYRPIYGVMAWMPLPEPWKEKKDEL